MRDEEAIGDAPVREDEATGNAEENRVAMFLIAIENIIVIKVSQKQELEMSEACTDPIWA